MTAMTGTRQSRPPTWALVLAFAIVYLSWGTTYFAIKEGVRTLPPALFGGPRLALAGLVLLGWLWVRGESLRLPREELGPLTLSAVFMFLGGNWLITLGEKTVDSGMASVLVATTPLFVAVTEWVGPWGERLTGRGWLGLLSGLVGVVVLFAPKLQHPGQVFEDAGPLLVLGSAVCWAVGSVFLRHGRRHCPPFLAAGYQMLVGGLGLTLVGLALGELRYLTAEAFTLPAVLAFFYLLAVGSLLGFVAYAWLLAHVSAALAGTYAYVNPVVALCVGWLLGGEQITPGIIVGMLVILAGVALVRSGGVQLPQAAGEAEGQAQLSPAAPWPPPARVPQRGGA
jgi:drug/metabolite transporter (DMT)-like permease